MRFDNSRFPGFDLGPDDGRESEFNLNEIIHFPTSEGLDLGSLVDEAQEWLISNTPSFQRLQAQVKRGDTPSQFQIDDALDSLERTFQKLSNADDTTHEDILGLNFALAIQLLNYERTEEGENRLYDLLAGLREETGDLIGLKAFVFNALGQNCLKEGDLCRAAEFFDDAIESIETHKIQHKETLLNAYANRAELYIYLTSKEDWRLT
ncbi:MAG: hypothetical protein GYA55_11720, partial [SAR324 cluster bacterium]|nr:hypothetical protein [SAR324 cluster bacterium]